MIDDESQNKKLTQTFWNLFITLHQSICFSTFLTSVKDVGRNMDDAEVCVDRNSGKVFVRFERHPGVTDPEPVVVLHPVGRGKVFVPI